MINKEINSVLINTLKEILKNEDYKFIFCSENNEHYEFNSNIPLNIKGKVLKISTKNELQLFLFNKNTILIKDLKELDLLFNEIFKKFYNNTSRVQRHRHKNEYKNIKEKYSITI